MAQKSTILNEVENLIHPERRAAPGTGATHVEGQAATGPARNTAGPHKSDLMNRVDPQVDSRPGVAAANAPATAGHPGATTTSGGMGAGTGATNAGTANQPVHNSRIANALDPRVDSNANGPQTGATPVGSQYPGATGAGAATGAHTGAHTGATTGATTGPGAGVATPGTTLGASTGATGGSNLPGTGTGGGYPGTGHGATGTTIGATGAAGNNVPEGTYGPHSSRLGNAVDPRVDSDRDTTGQGTLGHTQQHGAVGTGRGGAGNFHNTAGGTTAAPGTTVPTGGVAATGPAPNTSGPHKHDILNKLDPSVDHNAAGRTGAGGAFGV